MVTETCHPYTGLAALGNSVPGMVGFRNRAALSEKGVKVPRRVSVVGFTEDEIGAYTIPALTTMVQPIEEVGRKATEILLAKIKDSQRPKEKVLLPTTLLERSSVAPPER